MKKALAALATCFGLAAPTIAAEGYVQIGEGELLRHQNISMETCKNLGEKFAQHTIGLTFVNVVCAPDVKDLKKNPDLEQISYFCVRTEGPTICNFR